MKRINVTTEMVIRRNRFKGVFVQYHPYGPNRYLAWTKENISWEELRRRWRLSRQITLQKNTSAKEVHRIESNMVVSFGPLTRMGNKQITKRYGVLR